MHGDLISRSRAIENIWDVFNSYANDSQRFDEYETEAINNAFKVLQKCVENQQTAYDVEKVVADVKEENKRALKEMYKIHGNQYTTILLKKHNDKIDDIVRNGGKE